MEKQTTGVSNDEPIRDVDSALKYEGGIYRLLFE